MKSPQFHSTTTSAWPPPTGRIIKKKALAEWQQGQQIIALAQQEANRLILDAQAAVERLKATALSQANEEAASILAQKMTKLTAELQQEWKKSQEALATLALAIARQLVVEADDLERARGLAIRALESVRGQERVLLKVSPLEERTYRKISHSLKERFPSLEWIEVVEETDIPPGQLRVETKIGHVQTGIDSLWKSVESVLVREINPESPDSISLLEQAISIENSRIFSTSHRHNSALSNKASTAPCHGDPSC